MRLDRFSARAKQAGLTTRTAVVYTKLKAVTQETPAESAKQMGPNDLRTFAHTREVSDVVLQFAGFRNTTKHRRRTSTSSTTSAFSRLEQVDSCEVYRMW